MTVHLSPCGRGRIAQAIRVRGISPQLKLPLAFADADPSSVADFARATFSHKGRREKVHGRAASPEFMLI
jgi:hypothetical protein